MNIDTIKKFKTEFEYFLDHGEIWEKNMSCTENAWLLLSDPDFDKEYTYAINDEHANERQAFAEDKKIECYCKVFHTWEDSYFPSWNSDEKYRIKQEKEWFEDIPKEGMLFHVRNYPSESYGRVRLVKSIKRNKKRGLEFHDEDGNVWDSGAVLSPSKINKYLNNATNMINKEIIKNTKSF